MLAHSDFAVLPVAPITPTQRQLQQAHLERRQRLGLVPARPVRREPFRETTTQQPAPVLLRRAEVALVPAPEPEPVAAAAPVVAPPLDSVPKARGRQLLAEVAARHGVALADVVGRSKAPQVVRARDEASWLLAQHLGWSLHQVARMFDGRHHTSVLQGQRRHVARLAAAGEVAPPRDTGAVAQVQLEMADAIAAGVAARHGLGVFELTDREPARATRPARDELCWTLRQQLGWTQHQVGQWCGGCSAGWALKAERRHAERLEAGR